MNTTSGLPTDVTTSQPRRHRWRHVWRETFRPVTARRTDLSTSATVNAQFWLGQMPWRVTASWTALAGILAAGPPLLAGSLAWPTLVLLFLLVDPFWGALWRLAAGRVEQLPLHDRVIGGQFWLPYLKDDSPAAHVFGRDTGDTLPVLFRVALPTVVMTMLVASALGPVALIATLCVIVLTLFGWISTRRAHFTPVFLHSVVTVALPWILSARVTGVVVESPEWRNIVVMVALWVGHQWGSGRLLRVADDRLGLALLMLTDIGLGILLISLQTPLWLALWLLCILPTWLMVVQQRPLRKAALWQVGAMLASAAAVGQAII